MIKILLVALLFLVSTKADNFKTVSFKGPLDALLTEELRFNIPNEQCSGDVDKSLLCNNRKPNAVKLEVLDSQAYAMTYLDEFEKVQVQRAPDPNGLCPGLAQVTIYLDCRQREDLSR